jgi:uncharacterized membrane protein YfcA
MNPAIAIFGAGVGLLIGATGMGSGALMTPILIVIFGVHPAVAVGTDLCYGAIAQSFGAWRHLRARMVDTALARWLACGSVPGAVLGVVLIRVLRSTSGARVDRVILLAVAGAILLAGGVVLARAFMALREEPRYRDSGLRSPWAKAAAAAAAFPIGVIVGMTSTGAGSLMSVTLILVFRLAPRRVVGTDVFHAAILLSAAAIANLLIGTVNLPMVGNILLGSVPGVIIGSRMVVRVPAHVLRLVLGVVLLTSAIGVGIKAGVTVPPALFVVVALLLIAATSGAYLLARSDRSVPSPQDTAAAS